MEQMNKIDGRTFKLAFRKATENLVVHKDEINELNVFPVPDGDTGSNMIAAMIEACKNLDTLKGDYLPNVMDAIVKGTLMGARGNSGVILSQIFRGFAVYIDGKIEITTHDFSAALDSARKIAYSAVIKPVEGTILTLIRLLSNYAQKNLSEVTDFKEYMIDLCKAADRIVQMTPMFLPKLKQSGVVDAGAKGFYYILEGFKEAILGNVELRTKFIEATVDEIVRIAEEEVVFTYCTEFMISSELPQNLLVQKIDDLKSMLSEIGDSIVVVHTDNFVRVHVHTNHPGQAIEKGLELGDLVKSKIDNMKIQHKEILVKQVEKEQGQKETKEYGFVFVSPGEGISEIIKGLGVDEVVLGGQTMNPSTMDIKNAIEKVSASTVFVFPNNSNIILAAKQAKDLIKEKDVEVIETKTVQQGISAILAFNSDMEKEQIIKVMNDVIQKVKSISITYAVRDSNYNSTKIQEGDYLIFVDGELVKNGKNLKEIFLEVLENLDDIEDYEILTIYYGKDVTEEQAKELGKVVEERFENLEVETYRGDQPHYYYFISLE